MLKIGWKEITPLFLQNKEQTNAFKFIFDFNKMVKRSHEITRHINTILGEKVPRKLRIKKWFFSYVYIESNKYIVEG